MECRDSSQKFDLGPQKPPDSLSSGPHFSLVSPCGVPAGALAMEAQQSLSPGERHRQHANVACGANRCTNDFGTNGA